MYSSSKLSTENNFEVAVFEALKYHIALLFCSLCRESIEKYDSAKIKAKSQ